MFAGTLVEGGPAAWAEAQHKRKGATVLIDKTSIDWLQQSFLLEHILTWVEHILTFEPNLGILSWSKCVWDYEGTTEFLQHLDGNRRVVTSMVSHCGRLHVCLGMMTLLLLRPTFWRMSWRGSTDEESWPSTPSQTSMANHPQTLLWAGGPVEVMFSKRYCTILG